jgi:hypothetical protein
MTKTTLQLSEAVPLASSLTPSTASQTGGCASGMTLLANGVVSIGDQERNYLIRVETLNLVNCCPIWQMEESRRLAGKTSREIEEILKLRRQYSGRCVEVQFGEQPSGRCLQTSLQRLSYWLCRSEAFWWVRGTGIYLCQHEIRGD